MIERQLDLFVAEHAELIQTCDEAERRYERAGREEAEEAYGDFADLLGSGTEILAELRDHYGSTLEPDRAEQYAAAFARAVRARLPSFALEIEET